MSEDVVIRVESVSKSFRLPHERHSSLKSALFSTLKGKKRSFEKQKVLKDISFEIKKGEFFGIVGRNGSGKSTLLKLLAGVYSPDKGAITINGKLTPFIELGVGFNPELTGRENVFLNGSLLGFSRKEMENMYDEIVQFAELEKFMDQKLKNYSSGMQVRLAFSIAVRAQSDILLLDEVLAVGDTLFQKKCFEYFKTLKRNNKTVVFISHDSNALETYCDNGILINNGRLVSSGKISKIVREYNDLINNIEEKNTDTNKKSQEKRWGTGLVSITNYVAGQNEVSKNIFTDKDDNIEINVDYRFNHTIQSPIFGIIVRNSSNIIVFESNTHREKIKTGIYKNGATANVKWIIPNVFNTDIYFVSPAASNEEATEIFDWIDEAISFKIRKEKQSLAVINMEHILDIRRRTE